MTVEIIFADPRTTTDFDPSFLPSCDGEDLPPLDSRDRNLLRVIEFASIYYQMNRLTARAEAARAAGDFRAERAALENFRSASRKRDWLEDRYAPEGFLAEPIMDGNRYVDLKFRWAGKRPRASIYSKRFEVSLEL